MEEENKVSGSEKDTSPLPGVKEARGKSTDGGDISSSHKLSTPSQGEGRLEQRRGSHLLAAAGIDYERRRRLSHQNIEPRIYQEGNNYVMEGKDGKVTKLEVLEVVEKMGNLRKAVPTLPLCIAILLLFINTLLPGIGTLIGAGSVLCCGKTRHETRYNGIRYGIIAGIIQILTAIIMIGWIYSIVYGVQMVQDSMTRKASGPNSPSHDEEKPSGNA